MERRVFASLTALFALNSNCHAIADPAKPNLHPKTMHRSLFVPGEGLCNDNELVAKDGITPFSDRKELRKLWLVGMTSTCYIRNETQSWTDLRLQAILADSFDWIACLYDWGSSACGIALLVPELEPNYPVSDSHPRFFRSDAADLSVVASEESGKHEQIVHNFVSAYFTFKGEFLARLRLEKKVAAFKSQSGLKQERTVFSDTCESSREILVCLAGNKAVEQLESDLRKAFPQYPVAL